MIAKPATIKRKLTGAIMLTSVTVLVLTCAVFILYDIEGYGHAEIAALTGIAEGTSKAQLFRARRLLRKALER